MRGAGADGLVVAQRPGNVSVVTIVDGDLDLADHAG